MGAPGSGGSGGGSGGDLLAIGAVRASRL